MIYHLIGSSVKIYETADVLQLFALSSDHCTISLGTPIVLLIVWHEDT